MEAKILICLHSNERVSEHMYLNESREPYVSRKALNGSRFRSTHENFVFSTR